MYDVTIMYDVTKATTSAATILTFQFNFQIRHLKVLVILSYWCIKNLISGFSKYPNSVSVFPNTQKSYEIKNDPTFDTTDTFKSNFELKHVKVLPIGCTWYIENCSQVSENI